MPPFPPRFCLFDGAAAPPPRSLLRALSFPPFPRLPSVTFGGDPVPSRRSLSFPVSLCPFPVPSRLPSRSVSSVFVRVVTLFPRVPAKLIVSPLSGNLYVNRLESVESHAYV